MPDNDDHRDTLCMPPDQRVAWELADRFRAKYAKQHGRQPRAGLVRKRFDRFLAQVRSAL